MRKKILVWIASAASLQAAAQDSLKTTMLSEVVFSANRMDQTVLSVPRSISVINREMIENSAYSSLADLLAGQEGVYIVGQGQTPGTNQSVFLRGANSNQLVVLIDGKRITDPSGPNNSIDLSEISTANVERVEVIRGAHTTMYGGSAIGGVINIITKKNARSGFHGSVSIQPGTFGKSTWSLSEQADLGYSFKNGFYVNGSLWQQNAAGLDATTKTMPSTRYDHDGFRKTDVSLKTGFRNGTWDASLGFRNAHQLADIDQGAFIDDDNNYLEFQRSLVDYGITKKAGDNWSITLAGSYSRSLRVNENDSSVVDDTGATDKSYFIGNYSGRIQTHELQANYGRGNLKIVSGIGAYYDRMFFDTYYYSNAFGFPFEQSVDYDSLETTSTTAYLFGKLTWRLKAFDLGAGVRLSNHNSFGNFATFEFNPSLRLRAGLVYASVSTAFNPPSLYQLFDPSSGFGYYTTRGNGSLEPEKSVSFELGYKREFKNGSTLVVSGFSTQTRDAIEYVYLWNGEKTVESLDFSDYRGDTYVNLAATKVSGVETNAKVYIHPRVYLQENLTWMRGRFEASPSTIEQAETGDHHVQLYNYGAFLDEDVSEKNLIRRPPVASNTTLGIRVSDRVSMNASYRLTGARRDFEYDPTAGPFGALNDVAVRQYHLVDLSCVWNPTESLTLSGKIENLLDQQYSEIIGYRSRGRGIFVKALFRW